MIATVGYNGIYHNPETPLCYANEFGSKGYGFDIPNIFFITIHAILCHPAGAPGLDPGSVSGAIFVYYDVML